MDGNAHEDKDKHMPKPELILDTLKSLADHLPDEQKKELGKYLLEQKKTAPKNGRSIDETTLSRFVLLKQGLNYQTNEENGNEFISQRTKRCHSLTQIETQKNVGLNGVVSIPEASSGAQNFGQFGNHCIASDDHIEDSNSEADCAFNGLNLKTRHSIV